jgi:hypothetical protein
MKTKLTEPIHFRLSRTEAACVRAIAAAEERSTSDVLRRLVREGLKQVERERVDAAC